MKKSTISPAMRRDLLSAQRNEITDSLGVAVLSFGIGYVFRLLLGIEL